MLCKICKSKGEKIFTDVVLNKYNVDYFKCTKCSFIQTESPYWLNEAYCEAITSLDIGLLYRNNYLLPIVKTVITAFFDSKKTFIDYGGGYGVLVRLLRDSGFEFYRQDMYCQNLFAKDFDVSGDHLNRKYELLTAFEVFEHLENPVAELQKMLEYSDTILFSTEIQPDKNVRPVNWWYFVPETGQHIALHSIESLQELAFIFNLNFVSNGHNIHLFSKKKINPFLFRLFTKPRIARIYYFIFGSKRSLLQTDFDYIKNKLNET